jgi:PhnB protein
MARIYPLLHVADVDRTMAYYRDVLGFTLGHTVRDDSGRPFHGDVAWNGAILMFEPIEHLSDQARSVLGGGLILYFLDDAADSDIDMYYETVQRNGATIIDEIQDQFWGDRTFTIADPDGYILSFAKTVREVDPATLSAR